MVLFEADESFKTKSSPIIFFDDLRAGEHCDSRLEIKNWADKDYRLIKAKIFFVRI